MRVTVVGCSGSVPGPRSAASCYLVEAEGTESDDAGAEAGSEAGSGGGSRTWRVLLDLGSGALGPLQQYLDPREVDAVLLSHLHPDHFLDVCGLYVMIKHAPRSGPANQPADQPADRPSRRVPVWGPAGTGVRLAQAYGLAGGRDMSAELDVREWSDGEPVSVGPLTVTPIRVRHPVPAYGLRVEQAGRVLAYTGDTDSCPALAGLCADASVMLADAAFVEGVDQVRGIHLSAARAAQAAVDAGGVRRLVLTHLPPWVDAGSSARQARQVWAGRLDLAEPGAVYPV
jgi:ribonuclease BN (tRNA processing enzyme)